MKLTPTRGLVLAALFAALTVVGGKLQIPLGFTVITLQMLVGMLAGIVLGPKYGALSQGAYVLMGLVGLPVFAQGGGLGYLLVPSAGFALAFIPMAAVAGLVTRGSMDRKKIVMAALISWVVLYLIGLPYMAVVLNVYMGKGMGLGAILMAGLVGYIPGDLLKIAAVVAVAPPLCKALRRQ